MYILQTATLGALAWLFFRTKIRGVLYYVASWAAGVLVIRFRYGYAGEVLFYSNDQLHHRTVTNALIELGLQSDWRYLALSGRLAYTIPAAVFGWIGFDLVLSLKFVSLLAFLGTIAVTLRHLVRMGLTDSIVIRYITVLGPAGVFFSLLALRETAMLFFVTLFFVGAQRQQALATIGLLTLRPHLAVSLVVGLILAPLAQRLGKRLYYIALALSLFLPATLGNIGYSFGRWIVDGGDLSIDQTTLSSGAFSRILSNLVGLQFLAADPSTTEWNFADLMLARIPFLETILIPLLFTTCMILVPISTLTRWRVLMSFSFYLGLVTVTDFNSFRQNFPFMTILGLLTLMSWIQYKSSSHGVDSTPRKSVNA